MGTERSVMMLVWLHQLVTVLLGGLTTVTLQELEGIEHDLSSCGRESVHKLGLNKRHLSADPDVFAVGALWNEQPNRHATLISRIAPNGERLGLTPSRTPTLSECGTSHAGDTPRSRGP